LFKRIAWRIGGGARGRPASSPCPSPILLAAGGFKHRGHVAYDLENHTLLSVLFVRAMRSLGIAVRAFATGTGVVSEVQDGPCVRRLVPRRRDPMR
jgi:hypothetical protein